MHMMIMPNETERSDWIWDSYQCREAAEGFREYRGCLAYQECREGRDSPAEDREDFRERRGVHRQECKRRARLRRNSYRRPPLFPPLL